MILFKYLRAYIFERFSTVVEFEENWGGYLELAKKAFFGIKS